MTGSRRSQALTGAQPSGDHHAKYAGVGRNASRAAHQLTPSGLLVAQRILGICPLSVRAAADGCVVGQRL